METKYFHVSAKRGSFALCRVSMIELLNHCKVSSVLPLSPGKDKKFGMIWFTSGKDKRYLVSCWKFELKTKRCAWKGVQITSHLCWAVVHVHTGVRRRIQFQSEKPHKKMSQFS